MQKINSTLHVFTAWYTINVNSLGFFFLSICIDFVFTIPLPIDFSDFFFITCDQLICLCHTLFFWIYLIHRYPPQNTSWFSVTVHVFPIDSCRIRVGVCLQLTNTHMQTHMHLYYHSLARLKFKWFLQYHRRNGRRDQEKIQLSETATHCIIKDIFFLQP